MAATCRRRASSIRFPGVTVRLEAGAHIGHGAVIHGARSAATSLVGMNAVVMDRAAVGAGSIIGALTFVPADMQIPERKVVVGNPARVVKDVSDDMLAGRPRARASIRSCPARLHARPRALRAVAGGAGGAHTAGAVYQTWHERRGDAELARAVTARDRQGQGRFHRRSGSMRLKNYVHGEWVEGTGKATELYNAVTGEPIGEAPAPGGIDFAGRARATRARSAGPSSAP